MKIELMSRNIDRLNEVRGDDVVKAGMAAAIGQSGYTSAAEVSLSIR